MKSFATFATITGLASAHSWVHCTDYRGDTAIYEPDECFGNPRPIDGRVPGMTPFGVDTGFNQQPGATKCHSSEATHPSYPMATYQRGQPITLAWPAKNHVAAPCTNAWIPDTSLELFYAPFTSTEADNEWTQVTAASFTENPHEGGDMDFQGFQNCPDFCNNMDKALCTGSFVVPPLDDGTYTFQWRWEFNADTPEYVTCFEAQVSGDFDGVIPTRAPTDASQPVVQPTMPPHSNCGGEWSQCGGNSASSDCCTSGLTCFKKDNWYSQCRLTCPDEQGWECNEGAGPAPVVAPTVPPTTQVTPTEPPSTTPVTSCTSEQFKASPSKKLNANDATACWEKCQANKTKGNALCVGWEFAEGETKPCRLYTDASTSVAGSRDCHPTLGLQ